MHDDNQPGRRNAFRFREAEKMRETLDRVFGDDSGAVAALGSAYAAAGKPFGQSYRGFLFWVTFAVGGETWARAN